MKNIFLLFLLFPFCLNAQEITGRVTCNGDGLENVVVTDGIKCTITNKKGNYSLQTESRSTFVYLSTPSGYLAPRKNGNPIFYQRLNIAQQKEYNFVLSKNQKDDTKHLCMVHADPQLYAEKNLVPYNKILDDCIQSIQKNQDTDIIGIDCGDLVGDKPSLFEAYIQSTARLDIPFYKVIGNHDMTLNGRSHETSYAKFESLFGPAYYSFNRGKAHYIVLNDVFYLARQYFYMGYLEEKVLAWLEQDLSHVAKGSLVFVAMHIPSMLQEKQNNFQYTARDVASQLCNATFLHKMLAPYKAHILSGHMHYNKNVVHAPNLYEHITAAICGTWWQGKVCLDGTPQGYGVYEVDGDHLTWYFKSAGYPKEYQMRAYPVGSAKEYPKSVLVNVWNWDKAWKVELFENGEKTGDMQRVSTYDPAAEALCSDKEKLDFKWISASKNEHMFIATPQQANANLEVRVTDRFGETYQTTIK
ncbi:MAG: calcineurin-like phosphoesterase family protein [Bacteroidaceae bacterium]|nr:calcineurin-like phosphoesterase family protein [Bacteroidaceae bacterium]